MSLVSAVALIILSGFRKRADDTIMGNLSDSWDTPFAFLNIRSKCRTFLRRIHAITSKTLMPTAICILSWSDR